VGDHGADRSAFAGGDQAYLCDVQYADGSKLDVRTTLHRRFGTSPIPFPEFEAQLIDWPTDARVLECGCGTGRFWDAPSPPRSLRITVTDLSAGMVDEAVQRAMGMGFADVTGQVCDVQRLPFGDGTFDVVIANHMLYHVPNPDQAVRELARVLHPDGVALVGTNASGHMREMTEVREAAVGGVIHDELNTVFGLDTGEARLRPAFRTITWHAYRNDLVVDDPAAVVAYALSIPPLESADVAQREALTAAVQRRFVDGPMVIRTRAGVFVCKRPATAAAT
jgi:SAM-dependent methyltransferase